MMSFPGTYLIGSPEDRCTQRTQAPNGTRAPFRDGSQAGIFVVRR